MTLKLCYGTWQFDKNFKKVSKLEAEELIRLSIDNGLNSFDTALVYGKGEVEKLLSNRIDQNSFIITKIPAKTKPSLYEKEDIMHFYDIEWVDHCINSSLNNLQRKPDVFLLHNWSYHWNIDNEAISFINNLKEKGLCKKIGISLPNNYNEILDDNFLKKIDFIEAPYNIENRWIEKSISNIRKNGVYLALRSLFIQGKLLDKVHDREEYVAEEIKKAYELADMVIIGMSKKEHVIENIKLFQEMNKNDKL
ncbi:aldo/keto reductase [Priestia megaterium]|uniref:aldo/keto reductase n=1 Tax=Priestia megaterium TaxID=1404 RepID=UPI0015F61386|nr:aldo/keto reductase [Priestia megaterium]MEB4861264.1 aldo/keto reductase [Priestia megaterium]